MGADGTPVFRLEGRLRRVGDVVVGCVVIAVFTVMASCGSNGQSMESDISVHDVPRLDLKSDSLEVEDISGEVEDSHGFETYELPETNQGDVSGADQQLDAYAPDIFELLDTCIQGPCESVPQMKVAAMIAASASIGPRNIVPISQSELLLAAAAAGAEKLDCWFDGGNTAAVEFDKPAELLLVSLDTEIGSIGWTRHVEKGGICSGHFPSIARLPNGHIFWADSWDPGTSDLPGPPLDLGGELIEHHGYTDVFSTQIDQQGNHVWSEGFGGDESDCTWAVATDADGGLYFGGGYSGSGLDFGDGPLTAGSQEENFFLAKLGEDGVVAWSIASEGTGYASTTSLSTGLAPGVVASLTASKSLKVGAFEVESIGEEGDSIVARLSPTGESTWVRRLGVKAGETSTSLKGATGTWTPHGHYFYGRASHGSIDFGLGPLVVDAGEEHAASVLLRLDADGNTVWNKYLGVAKSPGTLAPVESTQYDLITGAVDLADTLYLSGEYHNGSLDWPGAVPDNEEGYGHFLARFDVEGEVMWAAALNGLVASIAEGPDGTMYAYGSVKEDVLRVNEQEFPVPEGEGNKLFVLSFKP